METTRGTAVFKVPAAWHVLEEEALTRLWYPERDGELVLVEVDEPAPEHAAQRAWQIARPDFARTVRQTLRGTPRDGWESLFAYSYDVPPNELRTIDAFVYRIGDRSLVVLADASTAASEQRASQLGMFDSSLVPKGIVRETLAGRPAQGLDAARLAKIDAFVDHARSQLQVPGVAIVIVQGGKVVHSKGFGVREHGKPAKVTPDTRFMVASNTKALTTLLLARLIDRGKLRWDTPVVDVMPSFRLGSEATTAATQVRHLICACTGLPRNDLEWHYEYRTPDWLMGSLAEIEPTTEFGKAFQYSNQLAAAAGFVGGAIAHPGDELGEAYDRAMQEEVLGPLGMRASTFSFTQAMRAQHASPHSTDIDGKLVLADPVPNRSVVPLRPTGGLWSTANDMIRYVQLELGRGVTPEGRRVVSAEQLMMRREPQVALDEHTTYGMGLIVDRTEGVVVVRHGGSLVGFKSQMLWLPDHDVGAVILTNADAGRTLLGVFERMLLEQLFDAKPRAASQLETDVENLKRWTVEERASLTIPPDPAVLAQLAPRYAHPTLGTIEVRRHEAGAVVDAGEWHSDLATRRNSDGTASIVAIDPVLPADYVLGTSPEGRRQLTLRDAQHEYVFVEATSDAGR